MNIASKSQKAALSQNENQEIRGFALVAIRIFKFFASLKLAVLVLVTLMIVLATGTFMESAQGTDAARIIIYESPWFSLLLFFLVMNLACAALDRMPWKIRHVGFVITHIGIITILSGSFLTQQTMIDGQISLAEGETDHRITLSEPLLYIYSGKEDRTWFFDLKKRAFPWRGEMPILHANDGEAIPFQLKVLANYPKATMRESISPAATGDPAVKVKLHNSFVDQEQWLMKNSEVQMGPATLKFTDEMLPENQIEAPAAGYLEFQFSGEKKQTIQIPLTQDLKLPKTFSLEGTPYQMKLQRVLRNAMVDGKQLLDEEDKEPGPGKNPAAEFLLIGPSLEEKHTVFAKFPDFPTVHGMKPSEANVKVFYRMANAGSSGERHEIRFVQKKGEASGDKLYCQIIEGVKVITHEVKKNEVIPTGWMGGLTVTVEEFYAAAQIERQFEPEHNLSENPEALPAIQIEIASLRQSDEAAAKTFWLRQGMREEIEIEGQPFVLMYGQKRIPAGFKLQLKDFRLKKYPGTDRPASFESDVILKDDSRGVMKEVKISMNEPLAYRGFHIYQSGYSQPEGQPEISTFSVGKDPGVPVKYLGAIVMVAGIVTMFYTRRFSSSGKTL